MITLPNTKQWTQENDSDLFGSVHVTKNINFDEKGYLRLSDSPRAVMNTAIDTDFREPLVVVRSQNYGYFVQTFSDSTQGHPFQIDADRILGVRPTQVATAGAPVGDLESDVLFSGGLMVATTKDDVYYYTPGSPGTWTNTNIVLTDAGAGEDAQHPIATAYNLAGIGIADVNTVKLYASPLVAAPTLLLTLTILADFYITSMCYFNQNLYVGTMNRKGGKAYLYVWNGYGTAAQSAFVVDSNIIFDICVHKDSVVCVTGAGQLLRFNGTGFTVLGNFPIFYTSRGMSDETAINMLHNCLKSNGDVLYINFNDAANKIVLTNQPDGMWCYDDEVGLYHRTSLSNSLVLIDTVTTANVNTTTDVITIAAAPVTGTEIIYYNGGSTTLTPLVSGTRYYVIKTGATTIKLATTKANAIASTAINLTGTGNNAQTFTSFPNVDFGQYIVKRTGALLPIERIIDQTAFGTDVIWGGKIFPRDNGTGTGYLGTVSTAVESRGYFVTPKVFSNDITDTFNLVTLKFSPFITDIDSIIIKYRTWDDRRDEIYVNASTDWSATWTSATTFTTVEPQFANAIVGNEVEFLRGAAAGLLAHITTISENAGIYTVTIDESYENYTAGDISTFVFRNWVKWKTIVAGDSNALKYFIAEQLGVSGKFIQLKVELRGVRVRIEELKIDNVYRLPVVGK